MKNRDIINVVLDRPPGTWCTCGKCETHRILVQLSIDEVLAACIGLSFLGEELQQRDNVGDEWREVCLSSLHSMQAAIAAQRP
jgi:hypothetical protein